MRRTPPCASAKTAAETNETGAQRGWKLCDEQPQSKIRYRLTSNFRTSLLRRPKIASTCSQGGQKYKEETDTCLQQHRKNVTSGLAPCRVQEAEETKHLRSKGGRPPGVGSLESMFQQARHRGQPPHDAAALTRSLRDDTARGTANLRFEPRHERVYEFYTLRRETYISYSLRPAVVAGTKDHNDKYLDNLETTTTVHSRKVPLRVASFDKNGTARAKKICISLQYNAHNTQKRAWLTR